MKVINIIYIIIFLILFMPFKIRIIKEYELKTKKSKTKILIYFIKIFNIKISVDKLLVLFFKRKHLKITDLKNLYLKYQKLLNVFARMTIIESATIIYTVNDVFLGVIGYNSIFYVRNILNSLFIGVNREYYNVNFNQNNEINFEIVFYSRLVYLLISFIRNLNFKRKGSVVNV